MSPLCFQRGVLSCSTNRKPIGRYCTRFVNVRASRNGTKRPEKLYSLFCQAPPSYGPGRYGFGFSGPRIPFCATGALWGRVTPFLDHFSKHLSSVLGRTELCHEVRNPGPLKPRSSATKTTTRNSLFCCQKVVLRHFSEFSPAISNTISQRESADMGTLRLGGH